MSRLLPALALLACSAVQAHSDDSSMRAQGQDPTRRAVPALQAAPAVHSAPEFHAAAAVAALTLLLGGVAVLKGWRHE